MGEKGQNREGKETRMRTRQLVSSAHGRLGRRPLLSRQARAVPRSSHARAPSLPLCACAQVSAPREGPAPASRSLFHPPGARPLCACAGEAGGSGCRLWGESSCQSVGRSSRRPSLPVLRGRRGGARPQDPQWGRSGDGSRPTERA